MTSDEFAERVKAKYPFYKDINNGTLVKKVLEKYPAYRDQITAPKGQSAWSMTKEVAGTKVPYLGAVADIIRNDIPTAIAERSGADAERVGGILGAAIRSKGIVESGTLGTMGELIPRTVGDLAVQGLAGPALKGVGAAGAAAKKVLGPAMKTAGNIGRGLIARDIGVAEPFIKNAMDNPKLLKNISEDPMVVQDHIQKVGQVLKQGVDKAGSRLGEIEDKFLQLHLEGKNTARVVMPDVHIKFKDELLRRGVSAAEGLAPNMRGTGGRFVGAVSKIEGLPAGDIDLIRKYLGDVDKIKDGASFQDLLNLRRRLGDEISWTGGTAPKIGSQGQRLLKGLREDINKKLYQLAPEMREADQVYAEARKSYDLLAAKYFGDRPETAYQHVKLAIQRGIAPEALIDRAAAINTRAERAMKGLVDLVSAQQFAPYVRKGIAGGFMGFGLPAAALYAPHAALADIGALAASSPRLAAMGIRGGAAASTGLSDAVSQIVRMVSQHPLAARAVGQGAIAATRPNTP